MAKGLGKGLDALFKDLGTDKDHNSSVQDISVKDIRPNPHQPRKIFNEEAIDELKQSIQSHGILQPIVLRKSIKGYEIVAGERRFRAAKAAGLKEVPAIVKELTEEQMMELALLENLQREDLTVMEEAAAYQLILDKLRITQADLAARIGKSRPHIANYVRLLGLPAEIQGFIAEGKLSMGHARALLGVKLEKQQSEAAKKAVNEGWTVRQMEDWIRKLNKKVSRETKPVKRDVFILDREEALRARFGTPVQIRQSKSGKKGKIEIEYMSADDLNRILELLDQETK
ncbi:ParB/RepB/Spo0J family partition protein [Domibacillus epiphyticus]|uniref:Chromosome partitioning protein ParB n=1 Tax=Domibacillus epiphyticus TaxID=1714355 RepID=A0A1V2A6A9_9BACI|nr:ParB/RepB/Spo0J family partition protein [Domibacillus epiphyticus]OMP66402.1 chromosome partitioning protein ParB [Domibacillus epiphyticus]